MGRSFGPLPREQLARCRRTHAWQTCKFRPQAPTDPIIRPRVPLLYEISIRPEFGEQRFKYIGSDVQQLPRSTHIYVYRQTRYRDQIIRGESVGVLIAATGRVPRVEPGASEAAMITMNAESEIA